MIKLEIIKQKYFWDCGPACLAMIFCYYKKCLNYPEILKMTKVMHGTDNIEMKKIAEKIGFRTFMKENSSFKDIKKFTKKKIPVIVNYIEPTMNWGHYSVVVGINSKMKLANPDTSKEEEWEFKEFEKRWISGSGKYKRWMLAVFEPIPLQN